MRSCGISSGMPKALRDSLTVAGSAIRDGPAQARDAREQARLVASRMGAGGPRPPRRGGRAHRHQDARRCGGRSAAARARGEGLFYERNRGGTTRRSYRRRGAFAQRSPDQSACGLGTGSGAQAGGSRRGVGRARGERHVDRRLGRGRQARHVQLAACGPGPLPPRRLGRRAAARQRAHAGAKGEGGARWSRRGTAGGGGARAAGARGADRRAARSVGRHAGAGSGRARTRGARGRPQGPGRSGAARGSGERVPGGCRAGPPRLARGWLPGARSRLLRERGAGRREQAVWASNRAGWLRTDHRLGRDRRTGARSRGGARGGLAPRPGRVEIARPMSQFPIRRMRRLRRTPALRRLVQETHLVPSQLVWPLFACHGEGIRREVTALPGVYQTSVDELVKDAERARRLGLGGIILFGLPAAKDATGSEAYDEQGIVQQAARTVKRAAPDLLVMGDACLCEYTDHGHCGVVQDGDVDNDASVYLLGKVAVTQARAGIDIVAPSDMMDGRVAGMRKALDAAGFSRVPIMSYAAKMASAFYGPFREAAGSAPQFGDRQSYQMQGTNADEAMREIRLDVEEGADIVLVKPALPCLDLIRRAKQEFGSPLAAYQVSGEYAMIKAAAARGMLDETRAMWETLYAIRRAGADIILSYFAPTAAEAL